MVVRDVRTRWCHDPACAMYKATVQAVQDG